MPYSKVVLPNAKLEEIFSCVKQPVYVVGPDFKVIYANSHAIDLVGKTKLMNKYCYEIFHDDKKQPDSCPWRRSACNLQVESSCNCQKGKVENPCRINAVSVKDSAGKMIAALHMIEVTTEVVHLAENLLQSNKELQLVNELSSILCQSLDLSQVLKNALGRLVEWSDFKSASVYMVKDGYIEMKAHKGLSADFVKKMKSILVGKELPGLAIEQKKVIISEDAQLDARTRTDLFKKERLHATLVVPVISKNKVLGALSLASENIRKFNPREIKLLETIADQVGVVMENSNLYQQTIVLSRTDNLTKLFNSRYFEEILHKQISWSKRKNKTFSLIMLDIDELKSINDLYGHDSGDVLLRKFAQTLRDNLRDSDFYARYGGDEFVVLLPESNEKMAKVVAKKLIKKVSSARIFGFDKKPLMTTSIGIAVFPKSASTVVSLVKAADIALYRAKQDGKNCVCLFEPSLLPEINFSSKRLGRIAQNADLNAIQTLVTAVDLRDKFTGVHSSEVSRLAVLLTDKLGLPTGDREKIRIAALLHDVGKIGISDKILLKPSKLSAKEYAQVKKHPELGVSILKYSKHFKKMLNIVLHHHERWDGKGYPYGLKGKKIPLLARIIAVADAYEAMTSDRPYRRAMSGKKALTQLWKFSGSQFDAELTKDFTSIIKELQKKEKSALTIERRN
ncbi:MAG: diguanylate cyclase [Actinobacteria bacterium]|nr:MAG: diguanylate cyclase [Actinomycetota bacterium]